MAAERVSVAEAARRLGITEPAVRQRIRRGTIRTERTDGVVWVMGAELPRGEGYGGGNADSTADTPPDDSADSTTVTAAVVAVLERANALAVEQLAVKDRQIEAMQRQIGELHVLLQQAQRALPAAVAEHLTSPAYHSAPAHPADPEPLPRAPWWRHIFRGSE